MLFRSANFQFYGEARSDGDGKLRFLTIRPPAYEGRPAHIHVKVTPRGGHTLTTQLYFADDPALARDGVARRLGKALALVTLRAEKGPRGQIEAATTLVVKRGPGGGR